jgi:uncharacterized protein (DUF2147 family)
MLRSNVRLIFGGCAAVAAGVLGGWTALAFLPERGPAVEPPDVATSIQDLGARAPAPAAAGESPAARPPAPAIAAPATPVPPAPTRTAAASGPTGIWIDHTGRGAVEITDCAGSLCGRIVWLKDAANKSVCGKQIIGNAKRTSPGTWDGGWIYDPDRESRYSVELKLVSSDRLRVMGYMGSKLFSETYTWKRATTDLARCDAPANASPSPAAGDPKAAPTETSKAEPSPDPSPEPASADKSPKSGNPSMADIEKMGRELLKGKPGSKDCTVKLPYVGTVTIPCPA